MNYNEVINKLNNDSNKYETFINKQKYINIKFNNDITNMNYEIQETSIDISSKFHKNLLNFIKEQKEINKNLRDELLVVRTFNEEQKVIIKEQHKKIEDLYYNIYYICISLIFINILI